MQALVGNNVSLPAGSTVKLSTTDLNNLMQALDIDVATAREAFDEAVAMVGVRDRSVHLDAGAKLNDLVAKSIKASSAKG